MTRQMSADLYPQSCTILENKNIFDVAPNFLAFTLPILGRYIMGRKNVSLYVSTKISKRTPGLEPESWPFPMLTSSRPFSLFSNHLASWWIRTQTPGILDDHPTYSANLSEFEHCQLYVCFSIVLKHQNYNFNLLVGHYRSNGTDVDSFPTYSSWRHNSSKSFAMPKLKNLKLCN